MDDRFDDTLFGILKEAKTIPNFFDIVFGFLYRRTDFYHISDDPNLGVGLPARVAEGCVRQGYLKYVKAHQILESSETQKVELTNGDDIPTDCVEEIIETSEKKQPVYDGYNGAVYDNYSWTQSINEVDIQIQMPEKVTSKHLSVIVTSSKVCVKMKNSNEVILEGDLCQKCKHQETIWSIDDFMLQIHLEKLQEMWWNCLITSEEKLDLSKMDCSRPFHELSDEAQAKIAELTWNQERKRQGLPTSDQLKLEKSLKNAWNAEGSPFTGEYDPSKVILN